MILPNTAVLEAEFPEWLSVELPTWAAAEKVWFDRLAEEKQNRIVIYGFGDLGRKILAGLRKAGIEPLGIVDARLAQANSAVEGLPCVSAAEGAKRWGDHAVFVVSVFNQTGARAFATIRQDLKTLGAQCVSYFIPLYWKYAEVFLPYYSIDLPSKMVAQADEVQEAFDLLRDERSREDFTFFLKSITAPEPEQTLPASDPGETYFPSEVIHLSDREVFVDCGAFQGDNLVKFQSLTHGRFKTYVGVEPDLGNYARLQACMAELRSSTTGDLESKPLAVGSHRHTVSFDSQSTISSAVVESGGTSVTVETLGAIVGDRVPTFVKFDIEGFELDAIKGAEQLLREHLPKLAVCVYHVQNHPWALALYIHELSPSYKLYLRRHREYLDDVVLYAVAN